MRLKYLWIEDFKNLKNFEIDFKKGDGLTMLIGTNGSGKSNILEVISAIFLDAYNNRSRITCKYLLSYEIEEQFVYIANTNNIVGNTPSYIQILALPCNRKASGKSPEIKHTIDEGEYAKLARRGDLTELIAQESKLRDLPVSSDGYESFVIQKPSRTDAYLPPKIIAIYSGEDDRLYNTYFRQAYMDFSTKLIKQDQFVKLRLQYIDKHFWWIAMLVLALGDLDNSHFFKEQLHVSEISTLKFYFDLKQVARNKYRLLNDFIAHINPQNHSEIKIQFGLIKDFFGDQNSGTQIFNIFNQGAMSETVKTIKHVEITFTNGFGLSALSEGEKKQLLFRLISDYLAEDNSLILLDEPDAHIHETKKIELYRTMVEIKNTNSRQIILTSHSPTLVNIADENQICAIKNINEVPHIIDTKELKQYKDFMGSLENVLSNKPILVTEGPDDIGYIKKAIEVLNFNNKYAALEFDYAYTGGTNNVENFKTTVSDLLNGRKLIFIFDGDAAGVKALCNAVGKEEFDSSKHSSNDKASKYIKTRDKDKIYKKNGIIYLLSKKPTDSENNWTIEDYLPKAIRQNCAMDCVLGTNGYMLNFTKDLQGAVKKKLYKNLDNYSTEELKGFEVILDSLLGIIDETATIEEV